MPEIFEVIFEQIDSYSDQLPARWREFTVNQFLAGEK